MNSPSAVGHQSSKTLWHNSWTTGLPVEGASDPAVWQQPHAFLHLYMYSPAPPSPSVCFLVFQILQQVSVHTTTV